MGTKNEYVLIHNSKNNNDPFEISPNPIKYVTKRGGKNQSENRTPNK